MLELRLYWILVAWLKLRHQGRTLAEYFHGHGYRNIAVYGMKELGICLVEELKDSGITVEYGIDRDADKLYVPLDLYKPEEELNPVDAVVITAIHFFNEISQSLSHKMSCPILSLEGIIFEL